MARIKVKRPARPASESVPIQSSGIKPEEGVEYVALAQERTGDEITFVDASSGRRVRVAAVDAELVNSAQGRWRLRQGRFKVEL